MNEWKEIELNEVCDEIVDCINKTAPKVDFETPYKMIRTTNVKKGVVNTTDVKYVTQEVYEKWTRRSIPQYGDVILTREAPLGEVGMITVHGEKIFLGQRLMSYRANPEKLDKHFLLYALQESYMQGQIKSFGSGSTVEHMRVGDAEKIKIKLPPLPVQKKIASILSTYDDLIENNNRRITILEEMAQKLYREWFVKFRFPGHEEVKMVESELGLIPEGWEVVKLSEVAKVNPESITARTAPESIKYIDISSVGTGSIDNVKEILFSESPSRARRKVAHQDIIWATVRPNRKQYAYIVNPEEDTIVSTGFAVIRAEKIPSSYLYFAVTTENYVNYLVNNASGSAYPAVNVNEFKNSDILQPTDMLLQQYAEVVDIFLSMIESLSKRNGNLKDQRDLLLPKLISGKIEVP